MNTPFRYDFVGSFLRPQKLKDARKNFEEGTISQEKLTAVEDECILELVAKERGCLAKGGEADTARAAGLLLDDFRSGRLGRITLEFPEPEKEVQHGE